MPQSRMPSLMSETIKRTQCEPGPQAVRHRSQGELRLDDIAAKEHENREAQRDANERRAMDALGPLLGAAIASWGKQEVYAIRIGVTKSTLSETVAGKRLVGPRDRLPLAEDPQAWAIWTNGLAQIGDLAVRYIRAPKVSAAEIEKRIVRRVLRDKSLRRIVLDDVAEEMGVEVGDLDLSLEVGDEPQPESVQHAPVSP